MPIPATKYIWFNGKLVPWEKATVHVLSHALHYGSSVFEGVRAYETPRGPAIFRLQGSHEAAVRLGEDLSHQHPVHRRPDQSRAAARSSRRTGWRAAPTCARWRFAGTAKPASCRRSIRPSKSRSPAGNGASISARPRTKASTSACPRGSASRPTRFPRWPRPAATICPASSSASRRSASGSSKASASRPTAP